ncbi:hypothetical protein RJT34_17732 [Clitoria ternatea]|uniref:Uncharacterized protein n=1 Tax=Clitoria ternatea TaxID=43366 RepID=A0AAN9J9H4_CLITE
MDLMEATNENYKHNKLGNQGISNSNARHKQETEERRKVSPEEPTRDKIPTKQTPPTWIMDEEENLVMVVMALGFQVSGCGGLGGWGLGEDGGVVVEGSGGGGGSRW